MDTENLKESVEALAKNKLEGLKLEVTIKIDSLIEDGELNLKVKELSDYAIKEAFAHGKLAGLPEEDLGKMYGELKDCLTGIFNPPEKKRADKYRQLYFNQRLITDCLRSALSYAESIPIIYEQDAVEKEFGPYTCLGATLRSPGDVLERAI